MTQKTTSRSHRFSQKSFKILGINFSSRPIDELLNEIEGLVIGDRKGKNYVVTPNPEFIVASKKHPNFRRIMNRAKISIPDGIGIVWAKKLVTSDQWPVASFGRRVLLAVKYGFWVLEGRLASKRVSGVDLMVEICHLGRKRGWRFFFLGAAPGVAARAAERLFSRQLFNSARPPFSRLTRALSLLKPRLFSGRALQVAYPGEKSRFQSASDGDLKQPVKGGLAPLAENSLIFGQNWAAFAGDGSSRGDRETVAAIKAAAKKLGGPIDVLFVAYGMRKQEEWIWRNLPKVPVKLAMGVGGAFDYLAGVVPRAPTWMRNVGLEWFYRLIHQPWRWRRQLNLFRFLWLILTSH